MIYSIQWWRIFNFGDHNIFTHKFDIWSTAVP